MNDRELELLAKLIETNGNAIEALTILLESQYLIAQALMPPMQIMEVVADDEPGPTIQ